MVNPQKAFLLLKQRCNSFSMSAGDTGEDPVTPGDNGLLVVTRAPEG